MVNYSVRDDIERAVKELNISHLEFAEVSKLNWENILRRTQDKLLVNASYKTNLHWGWQAFKEPRITLRFINDDGYKNLSNIINDDMVYFIAEDFREKMWVYEGKITSIIDIIGDCYYLDEYYIVSKKYEWVLCENHHGIFIGSGMTIVERMNEFINESTNNKKI